MTDTEKARRHLDKQNKRLRRMFWEALTTGGLFLLLAALFIGLGIKYERVRLQGPVQLSFGSFTTEYSPKSSKTVLITQSGEKFTIFHSVDVKRLREDQEAGLLRPGDPLTVRRYDWLFSDQVIATVSSPAKDYGSLEDFEAALHHDACACFWTCGILIAIWLVFVFLMCWFQRKQLAEIRRLRKKYRERLKKQNSTDDA